MNDKQLCDKQIREALKEDLANQKNVSFVLDEFELMNGKSRIDLFVFNNYFTGIEIKSDKDTLDRLPYQIQIYNKYLEKIDIVVGLTHLEKILKIIPKWWGVTSAISTGNNIQFEMIRKATLNPHFRSDYLLDFLWKNEVLELIVLYGHNSGIKSLSKFYLKEFAKSFISYQELKFFVFDFMKKRPNWKADALRRLNDG